MKINFQGLHTVPAPAENSVNCRYQRLGGMANGKQKLNTQQWALLFYKCNHCSEWFCCLCFEVSPRPKERKTREHLRLSGLEIIH